MQSVLNHRNIKPVHVSTFIDAILNYPTQLLDSKQIRYLLGVQSVMKHNAKQFALEEEERCKNTSEVMSSMLSSIHQFHQTAPTGVGTYTMEGRFEYGDQVLPLMRQACFTWGQESDDMFDTLESVESGDVDKKHMDQLVWSDIREVLGNNCASYVRSGSIVSRKRIESTERDIRMRRSLVTSLDDALKSMAWRQLEMIVFKIQFIRKLMQPEMASKSQGTRELGGMSSRLSTGKSCLENDSHGHRESDNSSVVDSEVEEGMVTTPQGESHHMTPSKRIPPDKNRVHEYKQKRKMRRIMREIKKERAASMHVLVQILWNIHTHKVKRRTEIAMRNASHKEVSELMVAAATLILEEEASKVEAETTSIQ
jgi:hypothetical protein